MRPWMSLRFFPVILIVGILVASPPPAGAKAKKKGKLLFLTLPAGFRHSMIPLSRQVVKEIGEKSGAFEATVVEDTAGFTPQNLKQYDAVMFNTSGELPMTDAQKRAFLDFLHAGGGFVGVHCATDTFYLWQPYHEVIGGYFNSHPWHESVRVEVADPGSGLVNFLAPSFEVRDEIYQIGDFKADTSHVLLRLDPASVNLKKDDVRNRYYGWPLAWTRRFGKGRIYYNALGHEEAVWQDARYQEMLLRGLRWAMGLDK